MDTPTPARRSRLVADTLRTLAGLVEVGAAVNITLTHGGYTLSVAPAGAAQADTTVEHPDIDAAVLLPHFLSHVERVILRDLVAHPGTGAKALMIRCGGRKLVEESRFWTIWSNLQQRRLVEDHEDTGKEPEGNDERVETPGRKGGGFQVTAPWIAELVAPTAASSSS